MRSLQAHTERHSVERIGWLRAAVLGANDGIVSTGSLIVGVAASDTGSAGVLLAGVAALVAGAMSMAAGEYVSVSSQSDSERANLATERRELAEQPAFEREELAQIYVGRGLDLELARKVADQLMARDALGAHARDELGLSDLSMARPLQAALTSAATFSAGAAAPLLAAAFAPERLLIVLVSLVSLLCLAVLGALGAIAGDASPWRSVVRVTFWGALAMTVTAGIGRLIGTSV
ncbi:VIT family protein [Sphingomonas sp. IC4-52]|uniref:VIT1/CCC1 transporter family protein n=1 Tax=Sphingomonas sp. IC4-52 TaxID=2887202 RepID=UPI001D1153A5|nr:VIT family protein [Sphingomonas sp. IC4-52]MCC2980995.1 VIT family protein [Sphingomonas sp. IC4-52]